MRTIKSYEKQIERLRAQHTALFKMDRFISMDTISRKIRECYAAIDRLKEKESNAIH